MKIYIDFSIFDSPVGAYGHATGYIELPSPPKIGDEIILFKDGISLSDIEFPGHLRVMSITPVEGNGHDNVVVGLEDVVVKSKEAARKLAKRLEDECGLFCPEYH